MSGLRQRSVGHVHLAPAPPRSPLRSPVRSVAAFAVPAAAREIEADDVIGLQGDAGLRRDRLTVHAELTGRPRLATEDPLRRLGKPARHRVELPWPGRVDGELDRLAEPTGLSAGTARVDPQRFGGEPDRRRRLDHFDRHRRHAGRVRTGVEAGLRRPGADATGVGEHRRDERAAVVVVAADLHRPHRPGPFGHRLERANLGERLEQRVGQEHPDDVAGGARLGRHGVDDGAFRGDHLDRREAAVVVGDLGAEHRSHRERRVGVGVVLDDVDAPRAGLGRTGVVDGDLAEFRVDGEGTDDVDPAAVGQVEQRARVVGARGQLADPGAGRRLRSADDLVGEVLDVVEAVLVAQRPEPLGADLARGHLGVQVAGHVVGLADVRQDEPPHVGVAFASLHQLDDRDPQAFLEHVAPTGADAVAADVGVVDRRAEERDHAVLAVVPVRHTGTRTVTSRS